MCNPMMLAVGSLAIGAGQAVVQYQAQNAAYQQQEQMYQANRQNALRAFTEKQKQTNLRMAQEDQAASEDRFDISLEHKAAMASNEASASAMNIYGNTVDTLMRDIISSEDRAIGRVNTNQDWTRQQLETRKRGQSFEALDRINSVPRGQKPNPLSLALNIGSSALNAGSAYHRMKS